VTGVPPAVSTTTPTDRQGLAPKGVYFKVCPKLLYT